VTRFKWHEWNLAKIAATLNIGLDSIVFVDDNPAECELVRQILPEVKTIQLPADPADYADLIRRSIDFEKLWITQDDKTKLEQYVQNRKRDEARQEIGDIEVYLRSLGTEVTIRPAAAADVSRTHQLFNKTNQFNLTTKRYSLGEVEAFVQGGLFHLDLVDATDRFGNLGTVGLVLIDIAAPAPRIDSFILSCRAMGREIETAIINQVKLDYLLNDGAARITARYVPTPKNKPVENLYEAQGLVVDSIGSDGSKEYVLEAKLAALKACESIAVKRISRS
jgi:FkbH-like protein